MAQEAPQIDPIHQFQIHDLVSFGDFGGAHIAFTNSALFMFIAVGGILLFLMFATNRYLMVPSRWQSVAEISYEFVASTVRDSAGTEGMKFFPLIFSLFMFVLVCNLLGMLPGGFTVTSHIIVTFALALLVFLTVIVVGFIKNGLGFLKLFVPHGVPIFILPLVVVIEIISFLSRPISLSVRLFANMLAGHIALKLFAGFVIALMFGLGVLGLPLALGSLALAVGLTALEFLVAFLQAYVFTILTCIYVNDALHPGH